jgi:mono/diheme cytochrome c family protein
MLWLALLLAQAGAPAEEVARGEKIFAARCAIGYCHGAGGSAGRAPRIQGRSFTAEYLLKVTRDGIPGTAMPAWRGLLSEEEIRAVVAFMLSISANPAAVVAKQEAGKETAAGAMPPRAKAGRELFFDAVRGTRCGTCHALENWGVAVGPNLAAATLRSIEELRRPPLRSVRTARLASGEQFPALLVEEKGGWIRLYDLTVPPPVLRTVAASELRWLESAGWDHSAAVRSYTDAELQAVFEYLRWLAAQ